MADAGAALAPEPTATGNAALREQAASAVRSSVAVNQRAADVLIAYLGYERVLSELDEGVEVWTWVVNQMAALDSRLQPHVDAVLSGARKAYGAALTEADILTRELRAKAKRRLRCLRDIVLERLEALEARKPEAEADAEAESAPAARPTRTRKAVTLLAPAEGAAPQRAQRSRKRPASAITEDDAEDDILDDAAAKERRLQLERDKLLARLNAIERALAATAQSARECGCSCPCGECCVWGDLDGETGLYSVRKVAGTEFLRVGKSKLGGRGVLATRIIRDGTVLGEYLGRAYEKLPIKDLSHPYALEVDDRTVIAWPCCWGGYLNSVLDGAEPNVRLEKLGDGRSQFVAVGDIAKGAELLWDYGPRYWKNHEARAEALRAALQAADSARGLDLLELSRHRK